MWSVWEAADLFVITTNSTLRLVDKNLVMGRGIALQAKKRFPGIAAALGSAIDAQCGSGGVYGLLVSPAWPTAKLAAFQVKQDWRDSADLDLIRRSTAMLVDWCKAHPDSQVHVNYPGVGNGRRKRADVKPIIDDLPQTVTVWEYTPATVNAPTAAPAEGKPTAENAHPTPPPMRLPQFIFDAWDKEASAEGYARFVAGKGAQSGVSDSAESVALNDDELAATLFAAGFKRGCAWRETRMRARQSQQPVPAMQAQNSRENGNALAGQYDHPTIQAGTITD
jgi:hypothetical protein